MLEITRQADYALRAVVEIARIPEGERVATAVVAERQHIPLPFLAKIVSQLSVRGILEATRGSSGGVRLARNPNTITMKDVIEAIDGPILLNTCVHDPLDCELSSSCPLCKVFVSAQQDLVNKLNNVSMAELIAESETLEAAISV